MNATGSSMSQDDVTVYDGREEKDGRQRFTGVAQHFTPTYAGPVDGVHDRLAHAEVLPVRHFLVEA